MSIVVTSNTVSETKPAAASEVTNEEVVDKQSASDSTESDETAEESETSDNESPADGENEATDDESNEDDAEVKPKGKKRGFQRRVEKLSKKLSAAEQEAEYWRKQALSRQDSEDSQQKKVAKPSESLKPKAEDFEGHDEYIEALSDWKAKQAVAEFKKEISETNARSEFQRQVSEHNRRVEKFAKQHDDFHDVIEEVDDIIASIAVEEIILASENGPELMYELAKNRDEFERINKLSPIAAARELGKFEERIKRASRENETRASKKTNAPKPITPVGSKTGSAKKSIYDSDISQAEYERLRREQRKPSDW